MDQPGIHKTTFKAKKSDLALRTEIGVSGVINSYSVVLVDPPVVVDPSVVVNPYQQPTLITKGTYYNQLKTKLDAVVALRNTNSWISSPNGNPFANPKNKSLMTVADGYNLQPGLLGLSTAYDATLEDKYLNWAYEKALQYISSGRQETSDNFLDWYSGPYNKSSNGWNFDHYEWRANMGVAHVLLTMIKYPNAKISTKANISKLASFLRDHMWKKWQPDAIENGKGKEANIKTVSTYFRTRIGLAVMALHLVYGDKEYLDYLNTMVIETTRMLERNYTPNVSANIWGRINDTDAGSWPKENIGTTDMSHASEIPAFMAWAKEFNYTVASPKALAALDLMLNKQIFISEKKGFADNVNGTSGKFKARHHGGWFKLLPYISQNRVDEIIRWSLIPGNVDNSSTSRENRTAIWATLLRLQADR